MMNPNALHKLGYGLYIVGSHDGDKLNGQIANTVFQITSDPPTVAVSINRNNLTHEYVTKSKVFSVSVLDRDATLEYIGNFGFKSGRDTDKLKGINYTLGQTGSPLFRDHVTAYLEAEVLQHVDAGTHTIFIGKVAAAEVLTDEPCMTYEHYFEVKKGATPKTAPSYIPQDQGGKSNMDKYECTICGYVYDPELGDSEGGIAPGTKFEDIPDDWVCPICGAAKSDFRKVE